MSEPFLIKIQKDFKGTVMANLKISINSKNINNIKDDIYKVVAKDNFFEEVLEILSFIIIIIL